MTDLLPAGKRAELEAEHGPIVAITHPDGSCFAFKRLDREAYDLHQKRVSREDGDAMERLVQMACVWPGKAEWNAYVAKSGFEPEAYQNVYRNAHGGLSARLLEADEIKEQELDDSKIHITNKEVTFSFKKPERQNVKLFRHMVLSSDPKATETLVRSCGTPEFNAWLDLNLFAAREFGDALVSAAGMDQTRIAK